MSHQQEDQQYSSSSSAPQQTKNSRIFIGGLEAGTTVERLEAEFSKFGSIEQTPWLGKSGTFGFIVYVDEQAAEDAVKAMNGQAVFNETPLRVEIAQPKPQGYRRPRYDNPHFDSGYNRRGGGRSYGGGSSGGPYGRSSYGSGGGYGRGPPREPRDSRDSRDGRDSYSSSHRDQYQDSSRHYGGDSERRYDSSGGSRHRGTGGEDGYRYPSREYRSSQYDSRSSRDYKS